MSELLTGIRATLLALIMDIDAALAQPPETPVGIPFTINLFGPAQGSGALSATLPSSPAFLGQALTASTKFLMMSHGFPEVLQARFVVVWTPTNLNSKIRLVHFADGPTDMQTIVDIPAPDASGQPRASGADVTAALNALVAAKVNRHVGFQGLGGGSVTINEVRLEVVFRLPGA
jgi:hypothetical protein